MALSLQIHILLLSSYLTCCEVYPRCHTVKWLPNGPGYDYYINCLISPSLDFNLAKINPNDTIGLQIICDGSLTIINKFPSAKFQHLPRLKELHIVDCAFKLLATDAFQGLNNLRRLKMSRSIHGIHTAIQTDLLCNMNNLNILNITGYNLRHMDEIGCGVNNTCCSPNLIRLQLYYNQLTVLERKDFLHFPKLELLSLDFCEIESIENGTFDQLKNLEFLSLKQNKLIEIDEKLFQRNSLLFFFGIENNQLAYLPVKIFHNLKHLAYLFLHNNSLCFNESSKDLFYGLDSLLHLSLKSNQISYLPFAIFDQLTSLEALSLNDNSIQQINDDNFHSLTSLKLLHLSNNSISTISHNAFANLKNLDELSLNNNKLSDVPNMQKMKELILLNLDSNNITNILPDSLMGLQKLQYIDFKRNKITSLRNTFKHTPRIEFIKLDSNQISYIEDGTFDTLKNLKYLGMTSNRIKEMKRLFTAVKVKLYLIENEIEEFDFSYINPELQLIELSFNKLGIIRNNFSHNLDNYKLVAFFARNNQLEDFKMNNFPSSIQSIDLTYNNIKNINGSSRSSYPNFSVLKLNNNYITEVNYDNFQFLKKDSPGQTFDPVLDLKKNPLLCSCNNNWLVSKKIKEELILVSEFCETTYNRIRQFSSHLAINNLTRKDLMCQDKQNCPSQCHCFYNDPMPEYILDCFNVSWQSPLPKLPVNATIIFFDSNNNIGSVGKTLLQHSAMVHTLYMNNSDLVSVDGNVFEGVPNLIELHLEENNLVKITGDEFYFTLKMEKLFLHQNQLEFISPDALKNLTKLRLLTLHRNKFINLQLWTIVPPNLSNITFSENRFDCNCDFTALFQEWVKKKQQIKFLDLDKTYCDGTTDLIIHYNGTNCNEVLKEVVKEVNRIATIIIPTLAIAIVFIILVIIIYLYRTEMKVLLYSKYGVRIFYQNQDVDDEKMYDAFISYANDDDEWVMETLVPKLDKYKLCLHQRDFPAGGFIVDSIVHAVENSSRTIILLTPNFVKSPWCKFEFDTAHVQSLEDRCKRLVVVLLEDVNQDEIDDNLSAYLKTNTYLDVKESLFWDKLKYALPDLKPTQQEHEEELETML